MTETPSTAELVAEMTRLSAKLDDALGFLYRQSSEWAEAENGYRMATSSLVAQAPEGLTVDMRRAWVDQRTSKERQRAHLADVMRQAAVEAVRSRRSQLSALQSIGNAVRAEAEMARTGP